MSFRPVSRRALASGAVVAAGVAVMRNLIKAQDSPEATPSPTVEPQLLIRIETDNPMQPGQSFVTVPEFSLFDNGYLYGLGPQLAIYPPPALPNLTRTRLSPEGVQALVAAARSAGLDQPRVVPADTQLADAPITTITFFDGEEYVASSATGLMIVTDPPAGWDEATWSDFTELRAIASLLIGYASHIEAAEIVEPERSIDPKRLQVTVYRSDNSFAETSGIPNLETPVLAWPLETPLSAIAAEDSGEGIAPSACVELTGDDLAAVIEVAKAGDLMSPWADAGAADDPILYGVLFKPLLPDQSACGA